MKPRKLKAESEKESSIARVLKGLRKGLYPSIRKAIDINGITYNFEYRSILSGIEEIISNTEIAEKLVFDYN